MSDARASQNTERLPWIANENDSGGQSYWRGTRQFGPGVMAALSVAALLLVLALAYWIAMRNWENPIPQKTEVVPKATTTVIPEPKKGVSSHARTPHKPRTSVRSSPLPTVRPTVQRPVPLQLPQPQSQVAARAKSSTPRTEVAKARPAPQPKSAAQTPKVEVAKVQPTTDLTPRAVASASDRRRPSAAARQGAPALPPSAYAMRGPPSFMTRPYFNSPQLQGRVVQVGAFKDIHQAKLWWGQMLRSYPQVGQLQPSVIESRYSNGVPYYRFEIGTNSPASSVMLCRMMQQISLSCSVTGLPGRGTTW